MYKNGKRPAQQDQSELIALATKFAGSKKKLAEIVGVSYDSLVKWGNNKQQMSAESILKIGKYVLIDCKDKNHDK